MLMDNFISIAKALSNEKRVRALVALVNGELCVCQIIDFLNLSPSTVSKHMSILRQARLVKGRKQGRWMYCRLPGEEAPREVQEIVTWVCESLAKDPIIKQDALSLKEILKKHQEERC